MLVIHIIRQSRLQSCLCAPTHQMLQTSCLTASKPEFCFKSTTATICWILCLTIHHKFNMVCMYLYLSLYFKQDSSVLWTVGFCEGLWLNPHHRRANSICVSNALKLVFVLTESIENWLLGFCSKESKSWTFSSLINHMSSISKSKIGTFSSMINPTSVFELS